MGDKMRWRFSDTNPVVAAVNGATVIEIGDLLYQDTDNAKPASLLQCEGPLGDRQGMFSSAFLGVAMQRSHKGDTNTVRVATAGVFEFGCPSGTFELGDLVGGSAHAVRTSLMNWCVEPVSDPAQAIARVAKREPAAVTSVLIDIRSRVMTNGIR